jgi:hypothetical protein
LPGSCRNSPNSIGERSLLDPLHQSDTVASDLADLAEPNILSGINRQARTPIIVEGASGHHQPAVTVDSDPQPVEDGGNRNGPGEIDRQPPLMFPCAAVHRALDTGAR